MEQVRSDELDNDKPLAAKLTWLDAFTRDRCGRTFDPAQLTQWLTDMEAGRPYVPVSPADARPSAPTAAAFDEASCQVETYGDLVHLGPQLRALQARGNEPDPGHLAQIHMSRQLILLGLLGRYVEVGPMDVAFDLPGVLHLLLASRFPLPLNDRVRALIHDKVPDTNKEAVAALAINNDGLQLLFALIAGVGTQGVAFSDTPASDAQLADPGLAPAFDALVGAVDEARAAAAERGLRPETIAGALLTIAADQPDMAEEVRLSLAGLFMWSLKDLLAPLSAVQSLPDVCEEIAARKMSLSLRVSVDAAQAFLKAMRPGRPS